MGARGNEGAWCMVGNHSIAVIAEAILKGTAISAAKAFQAMKATSLHDRDGMGLYMQMGYMPADKVQRSVRQIARSGYRRLVRGCRGPKLGKTEDAALFAQRAGSFKQYFDKESGFMRGKLSNGQWTTPFDPSYSKHEGSDYIIFLLPASNQLQ